MNIVVEILITHINNQGAGVMMIQNGEVNGEHRCRQLDHSYK